MMKGDETLNIPRSGLGSILTPSRPIVADYRVTTMKLRERVLNGRPQNQRYSRIKALRSAPPFQNRNLDNYPMPHGREDAIRSASGQRQQQMEKRDNINRARVDSESMKDYSKQMFDVAVKTVAKNGVNANNFKNRSKTRSEKSSENIRSNASSRTSVRCNVYNLSFDDSKCNNGPSRQGSILYNTRQQLLNAIRIRPHSEPVNIYNHEKNKSKPGLIDAIHEKNINYAVRPSRSSLHSRTGSVAGSLAGSTTTSSDYVLVPLNDNCVHKKFSSDTSFSDLNDSLEDVFDEDGDLNSMFKPVSLPESRLLPPSATYGLHLVSLDEESSSESEEEPEVVVQLPVDVKSIPPKLADKSVR